MEDGMESKVVTSDGFVTYQNLRNRHQLDEEGDKDSIEEPIYSEATSSSDLTSGNREVLYCELSFNQLQNVRPINKISEENSTVYATIVSSNDEK